MKQEVFKLLFNEENKKSFWGSSTASIMTLLYTHPPWDGLYRTIIWFWSQQLHDYVHNNLLWNRQMLSQVYKWWGHSSVLCVQSSDCSHSIVGWSLPSLGTHPVDVLTGVFDITSFAVNTVLSIDLKSLPTTILQLYIFINTWKNQRHNSWKKHSIVYKSTNISKQESQQAFSHWSDNEPQDI